MLLPPRIYATAQIPDRASKKAVSPFLKWPVQSPEDKLREEREKRRMLLVHQTGSVKVGEVVRYTLTYTPSQDRILPSPPHLHVKIRNASAIPLRAAYLHGPYTLHVSAYPATFNPNRKVESPKKEGVPEFEPNLKAGGSWSCKVVVPEDIRETGGSTGVGHKSNITSGKREGEDGEERPRSVTWILEITSQIIFSQSASVNFELLVGRDERSLELGFAAVAGSHHGNGPPGQVQDHQQGKNRMEGRHPAQPKGVYSKAIRLVVDDTASLWNKPALPEWRDGEDGEAGRGGEKDKANKVRKQKNIHLVILTHGLHSNLGADMLYLKESIDATARQARMDARKKRKDEKKKGRAAETAAASENMSRDAETDGDRRTSTAPLSGGQEDIDEDEAEEDNSDDEEVIVRGFPGNAVRTERGIQYLGKRLAKYVLQQTYPDQPFLPIKKTLKKKMSNTFLPSNNTRDRESDEGIPAHAGSSVHERIAQTRDDKLPYKYTSISFIGHSLGGLVQTYAVAYIHKHSPEFFQKIKPINFVCMASPLLGLSNENPVYVKFALDFGLVGRTGQDLGLTWRAPTIARSGWSAMVNGFGGGNQKEQNQEDPGAKPLLRILPTGPAHQVLRMFRNRTVYSNVVNDGIVPLRTSCLLFLDWRGLGRVEKARRENGLIGTLASFGFAELTGQNSSPNPSRLSIADEEYRQDDSGTSTPIGGDDDTTVPQPGENAAAMFDETQAAAEPSKSQFLSEDQRKEVKAETAAKKSNSPTSTVSTNPITGFINYLKGATTTPKDRKMYKRSQTIKIDRPDESSSTAHSSLSEQQHQQHIRTHGRPPATRGDSILDNPHNMEAPPKTTFFEAAGDIIKPPIPPTSWIIDPSRRSRTIFHDRVYHPEDIPPPPTKRPTRLGRSFSSTSVDQNSIRTTSTTDSIDSGGMRVEEKIARAYHKDLSWRKVLVRLEPDAHNNICVRRMFANAYGWPVIKHLCDTHFADTWAAKTRDEREPALDRAKGGLDSKVTERGEEVEGQTTKQPPQRSQSEMREAADELAPLQSGTPSVSVEAGVAAQDSAPATPAGYHKLRKEDSSLWDDAYFEGSDDEDDDSGVDDRGVFQRYFNPQTSTSSSSTPAAGSNSASASGSKVTMHSANRDQHQSQHRRQLSSMGEEDEGTGTGTSQADIADFLSKSPPSLTVEGHRGLGYDISPVKEGNGREEKDKGKPERRQTGASVPLPGDGAGDGVDKGEAERPVSGGGSSSGGRTSDLGLGKSVEELVGSPVEMTGEEEAGVAEQVAKMSLTKGEGRKH